MTKKIIIIGAGGHGKVLADLAIKNEYEVVGFLDDAKPIGQHGKFSILGCVDIASEYKDECEFVIAVGNNHTREKIANRLSLKWATLIHPAAVLGMDVEIGEGTVVMANAVINAGAKVGKHCIINTAAVIEHDNYLENYVHISPRATVAGEVCIGSRSHIGVGAAIKNNLKITSDVVVGVGAAVVKDLLEPGVYYGVPARMKS